VHSIAANNTAEGIEAAAAAVVDSRERRSKSGKSCRIQLLVAVAIVIRDRALSVLVLNSYV